MSSAAFVIWATPCQRLALRLFICRSALLCRCLPASWAICPRRGVRRGDLFLTPGGEADCWTAARLLPTTAASCRAGTVRPRPPGPRPSAATSTTYLDKVITSSSARSQRLSARETQQERTESVRRKGRRAFVQKGREYLEERTKSVRRKGPRALVGKDPERLYESTESVCAAVSQTSARLVEVPKFLAFFFSLPLFDFPYGPRR